jgi:hypothetical protein
MLLISDDTNALIALITLFNSDNGIRFLSCDAYQIIEMTSWV